MDGLIAWHGRIRCRCRVGEEGRGMSWRCQVEKAEQFEQKYNFRFEEQGAEQIVAHPRQVLGCSQYSTGSNTTGRGGCCGELRFEKQDADHAGTSTFAPGVAAAQ